MSATLSPTLAPDKSVPGRDALLDPAAFAAAIAEEAAVQVTAAARLRARYQIGRSLRVLHELDVAGERFLVAARSFQRNLAQIADEARRSAVPTGPLPPVIPLPGLDAVAWVYPNDRKLTELSTLETTVATLLQVERVALQLVAWAPEKSVVVRCDGRSGTVAYAKVYADTAAAREHGFHDELRTRLKGSDAVRVPRALGSDGNVLIVEPARGRRLRQVPSAAAADAYARYGRALAELHSLAPPLTAEPLERLESNELVAAGRLIGRARPDVAEDVLGLARRLVDCRPPPSGCGCLHGDPHPKNVLDDGDHVTLIDLDQIAAGDPAAELGSVTAGLGYRSVTGQLAAETVAALQSAFLGGYAEIKDVPAARTIAWYGAAAMIAERALRAVTRVRAEGLHHLAALVRHADAALEREPS